ncbi:hypothetical protein BBJ28_00002064 [Nothophytophthora sp. Chile5]|nr:hypothetical protein BBJ28_00002064 [Nothophytophthora sp. Chile5]
MQLLRPWLATAAALLLASALPTNLVQAEQANQLDFAACPASHNPEFYCCKYSETSMEVYTKYNRPTGDAYEEDYRKGWNEGRRVNYPYHKFTPDSPTFYYNEPNTVCRMQVIVTDFELGTKSYELQCANSNATLAEDSRDATVFWTSPTNARNNNASFPLGAQCSSLMDSDGQVDATAKAACASASSSVTPQFTTYGEGKLLLVYFLYLAVFVFIGLWMTYKQLLQTQNQSVNEISRKLLTSPATPLKSVAGYTESGRNSLVRNSDLLIQHAAGDSVLQTGYKASKVGYAVFAYFLAASVALNALIILVVCDYYAKFTPTLFGADNALVFFIVWAFSSVWFAAIVLVRERLVNFFRVRVPLANAEYVHLLKRDDTEVLLADRSGVSAFVQRIESLFSRKGKLSGYQQTVPVQKTGSLRQLQFQHLRYIFDDAENRFVPGAVALGATHRAIMRDAEGLSSSEAERRLETVGPNAVDVDMPSIGKSLIQEFFTLFYIYQIMCYYVWYYFTYWNLGIVMTIVVLGTAVINIYTKRKMQASIVQMTRYRTQVSVFRDNEWKVLDSPLVVPGDLVKVPENWILPCDMVIVRGSTVSDESMLTGESMPVQKFPIPDHSSTVYDPEGRSKKHTLFSGTRVLSSGRNEEILAVVQTTGAHTTKGQLIQSILFPVPMRFKYDEHLKALIALLLIYAVIACYLGISFLTSNGKLTNKMTAFCYCIFLISAVVSPLLPVVTTVGQVNAATRLQKSGIFSLNVQRITLCGKVRVFCFDKTGTLTKQGLDYLGVQPVAANDQVFLPIVKDADTATASKETQYALAMCHSVGSMDGQLVGNEVEVRMFSATGWTLVEKEGSQPYVTSPAGEELEFVKRFDFDHHRMAMSVVVRNRSTGQCFVFCKGSYERMQQLSQPSSVPSDYRAVADRLAKDGCYVLGLSYRELPSDWTTEQVDAFVSNRDAVDENLSLLGLILFRNELKEDTGAAIEQLKAGDIRVVMITGDNAMCGCYIARNSGMVASESRVILGAMVTAPQSLSRLVWRDVDDDSIEYTLPELKSKLAAGEDLELAITGTVFNHLISIGEMQNLLFKVRIFSRMTPDGKVECVKMHMDAGAVTGMCGDGGNDCGALRIAHAGVALSDAEASVVSPFTSKPKTIQSVVDICREGRCSVATSFASVKFLIMYGVIASTLRLFQWYHAVIMSEWCFILADGFTLVGLSYVITLSRPLRDLHEQRPTSSLIGPTTLTSIIGQEVINVIFLFNGVHLLINEVWYCPFTPDNVDLAKWWLLSDNHMATTLFFTVITQQQLAAWVFSFGSRYRASIWRNYLLVAFFAVLVVLDVYLILGEPSVVMDLFRISSATNVVVLPDIPMPFSFRVKYFGLLLGNVATVILFEYLVVLGPPRGILKKTQSPTAPVRKRPAESPDAWFQRVMQAKQLSPMDLCELFSYGDARKHPLVPLSHVCEVLFDLDPDSANGSDPVTKEMEDFLYQFATEERGSIVLNVREALRALDIWQSRVVSSRGSKSSTKLRDDSRPKAIVLESKNKKLLSAISSLQDTNLRLSRQVDASTWQSNEGVTPPAWSPRSRAAVAVRVTSKPSSIQVSPVKSAILSSSTALSSSKTLSSIVNRHEKELVTMANALQ